MVNVIENSRIIFIVLIPAPSPHVPGNTDAERMSNALRMVLTVSKEELLKKEARQKRTGDKKRGKRS